MCKIRAWGRTYNPCYGAIYLMKYSSFHGVEITLMCIRSSHHLSWAQNMVFVKGNYKDAVGLLSFVQFSIMIFFTVALIVHCVRIWLKFESSIPNIKNITSVYTVRFSLFWYHLIFNSNILITHMIIHLHWIFRVQYIATQCKAMIIYMMLTIVSHIVLSLVNGGYGSHSYGKLWFSSYLQSRVVFLYATFFEHWINNIILEMTQCGSFR